MKKANSISLDMLSILFKFKHHMINRFEMLITVSQVTENIEYWKSLSFKQYRHNFRIKYNESAMYIGVAHNSSNDKMEISGKIEYNPNKVDIKELEKHYKIITDILGCRNTFQIQSFDVAIDYDNLSMKNFKVDKLGLTSKEIESPTGHSITLGTRSSTRGLIRIYDKRSEMKSKQGIDIGYDKTRLELNFKPKINHNDREKILNEIKRKTVPEIYIVRDKQLDFFDDDKGKVSKYGDTDYMLYLGVLNGLYSVDDLKKSYRKKVKKILDRTGSSKINIDYNIIMSTLYTEILKLT